MSVLECNCVKPVYCFAQRWTLFLWLWPCSYLLFLISRQSWPPDTETFSYHKTMTGLNSWCSCYILNQNHRACVTCGMVEYFSWHTYTFLVFIVKQTQEVKIITYIQSLYTQRCDIFKTFFIMKWTWTCSFFDSHPSTSKLFQVTSLSFSSAYMLSVDDWIDIGEGLRQFLRGDHYIK